MPELPSDGRPLFVLATDITAPAIGIGVSCFVPTVQCGSFLTLNIYNLIFARPSGISKRTIEMQHKLVIALIVQVTFFDGTKSVRQICRFGRKFFL